MPSDAVPPFEILCDDGPLLAVNKRAGLLTVGAKPGVETLERQVKQYLKEKYDKSGNVYLGIPHRLDRPVSGVVVFSRNSKCAARLAEQFRDRQVRKIYWAVVERPPAELSGELVDWLLKLPDAANVQIAPDNTSGARESRLRFRAIDAVELTENLAATHESNDVDSLVRSILSLGTLLEIEPLTGRTHQIRVQLSEYGCPIVGDVQYGATGPNAHFQGTDPRDAPIALHARRLTLKHPIRYDDLTLTAPLPDWAGLSRHL